jgi:hypothetical protein
MRGEEVNYTTAKRPVSLLIIQYSLVAFYPCCHNFVTLNMQYPIAAKEGCLCKLNIIKFVRNFGALIVRACHRLFFSVQLSLCQAKL